jgi:hypothetical protein
MRTLITRAVAPRLDSSIGLVALAALFWTSAAAAESKTANPWAAERGWRLGLQIYSNVLDPEKPEDGADPDQLLLDDVGYGLTIIGGYAFTPEFAPRQGSTPPTRPRLSAPAPASYPPPAPTPT